MTTNSLKLTFNKKKPSSTTVVKKNKGINLFYNFKLSAISGLQNNMVFDKHSLKFSILKKRGNSVKHLLDTQFKTFQKLLINRKRTYFFLKANNIYKAIRLGMGLPIRGQRTHTNAKTARKFNRII